MLSRSHAEANPRRPRAHPCPDVGVHDKDAELGSAPPLAGPLLRGVLLSHVPHNLPIHEADGERAREVSLHSASCQSIGAPCFDVRVDSCVVGQREGEHVQEVTFIDVVDTHLGQPARLEEVCHARSTLHLALRVPQVHAGHKGTRAECDGLLSVEAPEVLEFRLASDFLDVSPGHDELRPEPIPVHLGADVFLFRHSLQQRRRSLGDACLSTIRAECKHANLGGEGKRRQNPEHKHRSR
mmetsp:Transcript_171894/g.550924  ORF Transcript_171894/g.550924 Transcript_171894/m.550924 type:complete len:240 (-) Transcript_171894:94-813(-)